MPLIELNPEGLIRSFGVALIVIGASWHHYTILRRILTERREAEKKILHRLRLIETRLGVVDEDEE